LPLAVLDWGSVIAALIAGIPATVAALLTYRNNRALQTRNGQKLGHQVDDALQTSIANNFRLKAISETFDVPMPDKASEVESRVESLNTLQTRKERRPHG
jgi:hypothetical protein